MRGFLPLCLLWTVQKKPHEWVRVDTFPVWNAHLEVTVMPGGGWDKLCCQQHERLGLEKSACFTGNRLVVNEANWQTKWQKRSQMCSVAEKARLLTSLSLEGRGNKPVEKKIHAYLSVGCLWCILTSDSLCKYLSYMCLNTDNAKGG